MHKYNSFVLFLFFISISFYSVAQELSVKTAVQDMSDLKASVDPRLDKKGNPCALLKISVPSIENMEFGDKVIDLSYSAGEYYVYIPANTKKIDILHPNYKPFELKFKDYGLDLEAKMTYSIHLMPNPNVSTFAPLENKKSQYVSFEIFPKDAKITINGETLIPNDGSITKLLPIGDYRYKAFALDYHDQEASISISKEQSTKINVELIPTFGWITIDGNIESQDAHVFVDDKEIGQLPVKSDRITSGAHSLIVKKDMYKTYHDLLIVEDAKTTNIQVELERNFSFVEVEAEDGVEVWINDTLRSVGSWDGKLLVGDYHIEARKENHISQYKTINVGVVDSPIKVKIPKLEPMLGTLIVNFEEGTEVWIGEEKIGVCPLTKTLTQGVYKVTMKKEGYNDNIASAIIKDNQECSIWGKMVPLGEEYQQTEANPLFETDNLRQFEVVNVVCLGHVTDSPMKMFDGDESTSFNVSQFVGKLQNDGYDQELHYYNQFQIYLGLDCIQFYVDSISIKGGNSEREKSFNESNTPNYVVFHEPQSWCSLTNCVFGSETETGMLYQTKQWQGRKMNPESDLPFGLGTRTLALHFLAYQSSDVYVTEMRIFGGPTLSWGDYEPYEDPEFLKSKEIYE